MNPTSVDQSADTRYVFDNAAQETQRRFSGLPIVFDPGTIRHLSERGVGPGWRCLEVGAGSGTIAAWLAERVGPGGHVLATDIDPRFLDKLHRANIEVRRHDITIDDLPPSTFDLVHSRLVLIHLPAREAAMARMAAALKPGGWMIIEDFDAASLKADPALDPAETELKSRAAMMQVMRSNGVDLRCGRRVAAWMRKLGLVEVGAEGRVFSWQGGSAGAGVDWANIQQMRAPILASGVVSESELEADLTKLDDPDVIYPSPVMWATWGRRPE